MPIDTSREGDLATFRVRGELSARQIMEAITAHFSCTPTRLALWDLREAIVSGIDADQFETLIKKSQQYADVRGPGARTAIVTRAGGDALLAKAYEARALVAGGSIVTRFFADLGSAQAWLRSP